MRIGKAGGAALAMLGGVVLASALPRGAQASVVYELVRGPGFAVEVAEPPFSAGTLIEGFLELPDEATGPNDVTFFGQTGASGVPGTLPVLDFRFAADGFEWTPQTGRFGILGSLVGGGIDLLLLGLERDSCDALVPCWFDIFGDAGELGLTVYQPSDPGAGHVLGFVAEGVGLSVPLPPAAAAPLFFIRLARVDPVPVPEPPALLILAGGLVAVALVRWRLGSVARPRRH